MSYELLKEKYYLGKPLGELISEKRKEYRRICDHLGNIMNSIPCPATLNKSLQNSKVDFNTFFEDFETVLKPIEKRVDEINSKLREGSQDPKELRRRYYYLIGIYYLDISNCNKSFPRVFDPLLKNINKQSDELISARNKLNELNEKKKEIIDKIDKMGKDISDGTYLATLNDELQVFENECNMKVSKGELGRNTAKGMYHDKEEEIDLKYKSFEKERNYLINIELCKINSDIESIIKKVKLLELGYTYEKANNIVREYLSKFPRGKNDSEPGKLEIERFDDECQIKIYGIKDQLIDMAKDHRLGEMLTLLNILGRKFDCNIFSYQETYIFMYELLENGKKKRMLLKKN